MWGYVWNLTLAVLLRILVDVYIVFLFVCKCTYINGSPQNTFVPGIVAMAEKNGVFIAGDDFKSGQTKLKSVLVDFLISAGIKPVSIVSYNHLGNNDGKNLSAPQQFRSKEVTFRHSATQFLQFSNVLFEDFQKQRSGRHGGFQQTSLQARRETRPLRRYKVRPIRR